MKFGQQERPWRRAGPAGAHAPVAAGRGLGQWLRRGAGRQQLPLRVPPPRHHLLRRSTSFAFTLHFSGVLCNLVLCNLIALKRSFLKCKIVTISLDEKRRCARMFNLFLQLTTFKDYFLLIVRLYINEKKYLRKNVRYVTFLFVNTNIGHDCLGCKHMSRR